MWPHGTDNNHLSLESKSGNLYSELESMSTVAKSLVKGSQRMIARNSYCWNELVFNPLMGTAIKHPMPGRVKPSFVIFDIRAL